MAYRPPSSAPDLTANDLALVDALAARCARPQTSAILERVYADQSVQQRLCRATTDQRLVIAYISGLVVAEIRIRQKAAA